MEKKVSMLPAGNKTIDKVLITTEGITDDLKVSGYFSNVILIKDLF